jgi:DNA-binding Lrp family transcriptional regulator
MARKICAETERALKMWRKNPQMSYNQIAKLTGVHHTTVMRAVTRVQNEEVKARLDKPLR